MYIDISQSGKYKRTLLRESYREEGKIKKRTISNISNCSDSDIAAIQFALEHKSKIPQMLDFINDKSYPCDEMPNLVCGKSVGASFAIAELAKRLGITQALGTGRNAQLALWQILARTIAQGSRLSAVRLDQIHALGAAVNLEKGFCEDDLYKNLAWLTENQDAIEDKIFHFRNKGNPINLLLYDVTSSYLEGEYNELANFGYNRDRKKGKMQIVIGLLCDHEGKPVSVQVFSGNTADPKTFNDQIKKASNRFGCKKVTFVGDRGMIKSAQKKDLADADFSYITALTKSQIETLEKNKIIHLGLFDDEICEVSFENIRYILRRNPVREEEIAKSRNSKEHNIELLCVNLNLYLKEHPRAIAEKALAKVTAKIDKLKCNWLCPRLDGRAIVIEKDEALLKEKSRLDGCYVITTDLSEDLADTEMIHKNYKDLQKVERAFRESKTGHLELRPIHVRKEDSTRGHVLVVMLAYILRMEMDKIWEHINTTVEEGIVGLTAISGIILSETENIKVLGVPKPNQYGTELLKALKIQLPKTIIQKNLKVDTRKKTKIRP